jgi:hypothetical protein
MNDVVFLTSEQTAIMLYFPESEVYSLRYIPDMGEVADGVPVKISGITYYKQAGYVIDNYGGVRVSSWAAFVPWLEKNIDKTVVFFRVEREKISADMNEMISLLEEEGIFAEGEPIPAQTLLRGIEPQIHIMDVD